MSATGCFYSGILSSTHGNNGTCFTIAAPASNHYAKNSLDKGDSGMNVARMNSAPIGYEVVSVNAVAMTAADLQNLVHPMPHRMNTTPATAIFTSSAGNHMHNLREDNNNAMCENDHSSYTTMNQSNFRNGLGLPAVRTQDATAVMESNEFSSQAPICRDFLRSVCRRGKRCRFRHVTPEEKESTLQNDIGSCGATSSPSTCHDYQNHGCSRFNCRFLHLSRTEEEHYRNTGELPSHALRQMVESGLAYAEETPICKDYQNGYCLRGARCKYRHHELAHPSNFPTNSTTTTYWPPYNECIYQQEKTSLSQPTLYTAPLDVYTQSSVVASNLTGVDEGTQQQQHIHMPSSIVFTSPQAGQILSLPSSTASAATISSYQHTQQPIFMNPSVVASTGMGSITTALTSGSCCLTPQAAAAMVGSTIQQAGGNGSNGVLPAAAGSGPTTTLLVPATMATLQPLAAASLSEQGHHVLTPAQVTIIPAVSASAVHDASNIVTITNACRTVPCSAVHMSATGDLLTVLPTLSLTRSQPPTHSITGTNNLSIHPATVTLISASSANAINECSSNSSHTIITTATSSNMRNQHHPVDCSSASVQTSFSTSSCTSAEDSISRCSSNGTATHTSIALSESGEEFMCDKSETEEGGHSKGAPERKKARRSDAEDVTMKGKCNSNFSNKKMDFNQSERMHGGSSGYESTQKDFHTSKTHHSDSGGRNSGNSNNSSNKSSQRQMQQQQLSMLKQMDELHRENRELRKALDDMKKQNGDLRAANEVLLDQNARLRNKNHRHLSEVSKTSAVAMPHFIQANTLSAASVCPMLPTVNVLSAVNPAPHDSGRPPNAQLRDCLTSSGTMTLYPSPAVSHSSVH